MVVENAHAEVRTMEAFDGAGRSDDDAVEKRQRSGRLDAIGAIGCKLILQGRILPLGRRHSSLFSEVQMVRKVAASRSHLAGCG